jgi:hypothetical protein
MKRGHVSWSNFTDFVEGPCVVCGNEVRFVLPADRPDPALLYHATCDPMPVLRQQLKSLSVPALPSEYTVRKSNGAAASADNPPKA